MIYRLISECGCMRGLPNTFIIDHQEPAGVINVRSFKIPGPTLYTIAIFFFTIKHEIVKKKERKKKRQGTETFYSTDPFVTEAAKINNLILFYDFGLC